MISYCHKTFLRDQVRQARAGYFSHGCKTWLFLLLFFLVINALPAQNLPLESISSEQGLSQNLVNYILQDRKGFIWVGTRGGLNRYDGYGFKVFRHNPFDSLSLGDNRIQQLLENRFGQIWVGTMSGIDIFNPETETFISISPKDQNMTIEALMEDWDGSIWGVVNESNVFHVEPTGKESGDLKMEFITSEQKNNPHLFNEVIGIAQVGKDTFWLEYRSQRKINEVVFDREEKTFRIVNEFRGFPQELRTMMLDTLNFPKYLGWGIEQDVWLGLDQYLVKFSKAEREYSFYDFSKNGSFDFSHNWNFTNELIGLSTDLVMETQFSGGYFFHLSNGTIDSLTNRLNPMLNSGLNRGMMDRSGAIWMGTYGLGLLKLDQKAKRFALNQHLAIADLTKGKSIRTMYETSTGEVFFSLQSEQVIVWDAIKEEVETPGIYRTINSIIEDEDQRIWLGESALFLVQKNRTGKWEVKDTFSIYTPEELSDEGASAGKICDIIDDGKEGLWVATPVELCYFDKQKKDFTHYRFHERIPFFLPEYTSLHKDEKGLIWIGSPFGLYRFDSTEKTFKLYSTDFNDKNSLSYHVIKCLEPDFENPDRYLWIGTGGGGLNRFDKQTETFEHFTEKDGLPDMVIYAALFDKNGNLWMTTNNGLSVFNPHLGSFQNFDVKDGLQDNEFNSNAYHKGKSGIFYFGGIRGYNAFRPEDILIANQHQPPIVITDFKISNRSVSVRDSSSILKKAIPYEEQIVLNFDQKSFSFEFAALDFTEPSKNQYAVKMEGFDNDWQYLGNTRSATYTNLNPGTYTFWVKGSNNDRVWNEEGTSVKVTILPPWSRTWWAYLGYGLIVGGLFYFFIKKELREQELQYRLELEQVEAEKLKEVDQLKSRFFTNISHEFRTPLTLILGQIESSLEQISEKGLRSKLGMAFRNGKRLQQLINQLLDLAKLEAGSMQLHAAEKDLIPFLKNLCFSFESFAEQRRIGLEFECEIATMPLCFDEYKLEKVFFNLLSNAIKFTPEGGTIAMIIEKADAPFFVKITISDTGVGIPAERLTRVFDRFYQVDSSRTREQEGTGIGLALVKEFVELHHGQVAVSSQEGVGTNFVVLLPYGEITEKPLEGGKSAFRLSPSETIQSTDRPARTFTESEKRNDVAQLLIVEDNADVRSYLHEHLAGAGYQIREAVNGEDGLVLAQEHLPDLIITDVMMPRMDGYEFSRRIRSDERTSHIPLIILTAKAAEDDRIEGLEIGVDDYLTKPFSSKELQVRVANLIRLRRQLRERFSTVTIIHPSEVSSISVDQKFLEKVLKTIETRLGDEQFAVEPLSNTVNMSVTHLNRKLNALIGQSAGHLIRSMRLQRAADLLSQNVGSIKEIAYQVGFTVPENFSRSFKKQFGCSPMEYQQKTADVQK